MSNSKLQDYQREFLRDFKRDNPEVQFFSFPVCGVTVGIRRTCNSMGDFAVSIASNTEQKFRRKVGQFKVAERFASGVFLPVHIGYTDTECIAENIARAVA